MQMIQVSLGSEGAAEQFWTLIATHLDLITDSSESVY